MCRIDESISGSYTGRMAPPGRPNMTSTPSISRLLMRAWAPVSFMISSSAGFEGTTTWAGCAPAPGHEKPPACGRGVESARARRGGRALHNDYEEVRRAGGGCRRHSAHPTTTPGFRLQETCDGNCKGPGAEAPGPAQSYRLTA